jgi:hypothetical protein
MYQLPQSRFLEKLKDLLHEKSTNFFSSKSEEAGIDRLIPTKVCPSCTEGRTHWSIELRDGSVDKLVTSR